MPLTFPSSVYLPIPLISRPAHLPPVFNVTLFFHHRFLFDPYTSNPPPPFLFHLPTPSSPLFRCCTGSLWRTTYNCFQVSISGPSAVELPHTHLVSSTTSLDHNLLVSSETTLSCGLMPPIMSTSSSPLPQSLRPLLPHPPCRPVFRKSLLPASLLPASPTQGQSRVVATNHSMSGSLSWWSTVSEQHS